MNKLIKIYDSFHSLSDSWLSQQAGGSRFNVDSN